MRQSLPMWVFNVILESHLDSEFGEGLKGEEYGPGYPSRMVHFACLSHMHRDSPQSHASFVIGSKVFEFFRLVIKNASKEAKNLARFTRKIPQPIILTSPLSLILE